MVALYAPAETAVLAQVVTKILSLGDPLDLTRVDISKGDGSPEGIVEGTKGDIYVDDTTPAIWQKATPWEDGPFGWILLSASDISALEAAVLALQLIVASLQAQVTVNTADIATNTAAIATLNVEVAALEQASESSTFNVVTFGADPTGVGDSTAAVTAATAAADASGGGVVYFPAGTYRITSTILYPGDITFRGAGTQATLLQYTGANFCFSQSTPGARIFNTRFQELEITYVAPATGGILLDDVSNARLDDVLVSGPGIGVGNGSAYRVSGSTNGFAVYNIFIGCRAQSCEIGYEVAASGSNDTRVIASRATSCTQGVSVTNSNHVMVVASEIESGTDGVVITASVANTGDGLTLIGNRFENNSGTNILVSGTAGNVRFLNIKGNHHVTGTAYGNTSSTVNPSIYGDTGTAQQQERVVTALTDASGTPFYRERTVAASTNPMVFVLDSNTGSGTPPTLRLGTGRSAGHVFGVGTWNGTTFTETLFIDGAGNVTTPAGLTVGTNLTFTGAASTITMGDGVTNGNAGLLFQKADANNDTYATWRLGAVSSGNRWAEQFSSAEDRVGIVADTSGVGLAIRPYTFRYNSINGRAGFAMSRMWCDLGTTLVDGNWALSAGWGNTATAVVAANAKGMRGQVTFTSNGTGQAANPTATLTFPEGTWTTAPEPMVVRNGGTGTGITGFTFACTATTLVITAVGTPSAGETYIMRWMLMG
jgi:hypothetical protein